MPLSHLPASDHVDGEISINNPVADITDVFTFISPNDSSKLVIVLNSYPFVKSSGHFSEKLKYSLLVRPVKAEGSGVTTGFLASGQTARFDCQFSIPHSGSLHKNAPHTMTCTLPSGKTLTVPLNDESTREIHGVRAFAGRRADPFLFSASWFSKIAFDKCLPPANASNDLEDINVLSIVLEMNWKNVLGTGAWPLLAVAGETSRTGEKGKRIIIDRAARPEISNAHLVTSVGQQDLRELYNSEKTFHLNSEHKQLYAARMAENIRYYDALDGVSDWAVPWQDTLVNILVNDYLIIDTRKPFSPSGYMDVERSRLKSQPPTRSGGRVPGENVIDRLMTTLVNGHHGAAVTNGIAPTGLPNKEFPYLARPSQGLMAFFKPYLAPGMTSELALTVREKNKQCQKG
ncbi:MAG: DUF4331 family protein [Endozoicomonas sp.]